MKAIIFDTETTGLIDNGTAKLEKQPEVIEFYACVADLKTGKIAQELDLLIKPQREISAEITKITGITPAMVEGAPAFGAVSDRVKAILNVATAPLAIAHNASFDKEMLDIEFKRLGGWIAWPRLICTVEQTVHLKGFRLSLSNLHELLFNEPFTGAHRAKVDVAALTRCCVELFKRGML